MVSRNAGPRPGIQAVADQAGVSIGTVSNVLNHPDRVSSDTTRRVRDAMTRLGFVRNESARQLRVGHGRVVGLVVLNTANPFFADVATGVEQVADRRGNVVAVANSGGHRTREQRHLEILLEQRVQGLLITPVDGDLPILDRFRALDIPVVFVGHAADGPDRCVVTSDDVTGGRLAGRHLIDQGRRRIAFLGGGPDASGPVRDRAQGLREAVATTDDGDRARVLTIDTKVLSIDAGGAAAADLLDHHEVDAIFAANDLLALGALQTLVARGIAVPDDIALVGYDDIDFARGAAIPLTSVRQPRVELGAMATRLMFEELDHPDIHEHRLVQFTPRLVVRRSSTA